MWQMMMCTTCMSGELHVFKIIIIYVFFIEFIETKKIREKWWTDDDVYILHVKIYAIKTCSG
jgi:hypothetical protein